MPPEPETCSTRARRHAPVRRAGSRAATLDACPRPGRVPPDGCSGLLAQEQRSRRRGRSAGSPALRRNGTGWRGRGSAVDRLPALHGRPLRVPGVPAQVGELGRPRDMEGLPLRHLVTSAARSCRRSSAWNPAVARSRCSYGSAALAENVDTTITVADRAGKDTGPSRKVTRPGESPAIVARLRVADSRWRRTPDQRATAQPTAASGDRARRPMAGGQSDRLAPLRRRPRVDCRCDVEEQHDWGPGRYLTMVPPERVRVA
jgi:hypothetical protein